MYTDVYIDAGEGWRWKFTVVDEAGLFEIRSEEWDEKERIWRDTGPAGALHVEAIPLIVEALQTLKKSNDSLTG